MKTWKTEALRVLRTMHTEGIIRSIHSKNQYMPATMIALHKIVLRERGMLHKLNFKG